MNYALFLDEAINRSVISARQTIVAIAEDLVKGNENLALSGAMDALEACRYKLPHELQFLLKEATENRILNRDNENRLYHRHYEIEVEWICNLVSVLLRSLGNPPLAAHFPSSKAVLAVSDIMKTANVGGDDQTGSRRVVNLPKNTQGVDPQTASGGLKSKIVIFGNVFDMDETPEEGGDGGAIGGDGGIKGGK